MALITMEKVFAGIDVGAEELVLVSRVGDKSMAAQSFLNTNADRIRLVQKLAKIPDCTVCLEATGVYSMALSVALHDAAIRVMVINPQASHNFAKVLGKHSKTDNVDADTLAQYAERMPFQQWVRPSDHKSRCVHSRAVFMLSPSKKPPPKTKRMRCRLSRLPTRLSCVI
jgi:transposase